MKSETSKKARIQFEHKQPCGCVMQVVHDAFENEKVVGYEIEKVRGSLSIICPIHKASIDAQLA